MAARALGLAGRALLRPLASPGAQRLLSTDKGPLQGLTDAGDPMSRLVMQARNQTGGGFSRQFAENGFTAGGGRMGENGFTAGDARMGGNGFTAGDGRMGGNGFTAGGGRMGGNGFTAGGGRMGGNGFTAGGRSGRFNMEMLRPEGVPRVKRDVLHVTLKGKKTFVTVTDVKGNRKAGASAGCLEDRKGRSRLARYAGEATGEHMGRVANKIGLKSVVVKVKGYSFFRKKKKVIMGFADGFRGERVRTPSPIMYVHDVTQLAHNGCRLPKKVRK
ncbi:probable ribosomal protein S11, mitochondrial [Hordeum vulgare subsp. vulgare]|uniref:probable ribosomal protein S11, mitochondrial n=1 Tax=Hordeum vulgare subsp. vulgare TaxID=112509 RepID=UPI0002954335|nr:probable ribosomal protein S11, mitochondrial [Hordeum vulgare subsp. vulgare]